MDYAPIVLFVYNRPEHTRNILESLSLNVLADKSELFIYADGPKSTADEKQIHQIELTRQVIREKKWCNKVHIIESDKNKGLATSILEGVTNIINQFGKIIVLEDDLILGKYFLEYMNNCLEIYKNQSEIWHITGWRIPTQSKLKKSTYFYPIMDCWSWATWADRWQYFEKNPIKLKKTFTRKDKYRFNADNCDKNNWLQVELNLANVINTWAIFWYATIFLHSGLCVGPSSSLVSNNGLDASGTDILFSDKKLDVLSDINVEITNYESKIEINQEEYNKNKLYAKKLKRNKPLILFVKKTLLYFGLFGKVKKFRKKIK